MQAIPQHADGQCDDGGFKLDTVSVPVVAEAAVERKEVRRVRPLLSELQVPEAGAGAGSQWISGSVDQWWKALPRRSRGQTQATRGYNDPPQGQLACPVAFVCVLNTRGCPEVFYTAPVIHPVRVHKYPWQAS
jgi:hypothetical protein